MSTDETRHRLGRLGSPHGLDGFIGIYVDEPDAVLLQPGAQIYVAGQAVEIRDARRRDKGWQIALSGYLDRTSVERLRGATVEVTERRDLREDEYWPEDLVGLDVVDPTGKDIGTVVGVSHGPAQDRLVIRTPSGDYDVPFVSELVPVVDLERRIAVVSPIDDLISEPRSQQ